MRIREIAVKSLFGIFDHVVPMHLEDRVTIVHGPNGFGKTTLLKLVESVFGGKYAELRKTPFQSLTVSFEDGRILRVIRREMPKSKARPSSVTLDISIEKGQELQTAALRGASPENVPLHLIESFVPWLRQEGDFTWRDTRTRELFGFEELARAYAPQFPSGFFEGGPPADEEPEWLVKLRKEVPVRLIESQRLLRIGKSREHRELEETYRPSVSVYSKELAGHIQKKLAEYGALSQSLDRSFPRRLVEQRSEKPGPPVEELMVKLQELEAKRKRLTDAGLLDKGEEEFDFGRDAIDPTLTSSVLPVYARDMEQKLAVFDELAKKIELLQSIVKARFLYKDMILNKESGFVFTTAASKPLAATHLSSGEQHMLVLLYELLFKVRRNSLIMIDEPEISLHIGWQLEFLRDLQRITELSSIDVLMATHAPGIINDRWDLTVELKPPVVR